MMAKPKKKKSNMKSTAIIVAVVIIGLIILGIGWSTFGGKIMNLIDPADGGGGNETEEDTDDPPVAILSASASKVQLGIPIFFDGNESYDPGYGGNISNKGIKFFIWDFGYNTEDGTRAQETTTNGTRDHTFPESRSYIVTLTVVDELEQEDSTELNITVVPQNLTIATSSPILIEEPIGPIQPANQTEINRTLEDGATRMNLTFTVSGVDIRDMGPAKVEIYLENPYADILENITLDVTVQDSFTWDFGPSDLKVDGMYNLVIRALGGTARVSISGSATYL
jgi:PKD repeat protein